MRKARISIILRQAVAKRYNGRCAACGLSDSSALQADHVIPESEGGETTLDNLQALCVVCNNIKHKTNIGRLPIRPPIEGFGDKPTVLKERLMFIDKVALVRRERLATLRQQVAIWQAEGVKMLTIRKRLEGLVGQQADKLLRECRDLKEANEPPYRD